MLRTSPVTLAAVALVGGCIGVVDKEDSGLGGQDDIPELRQYICEIWSCEKTLIVDMAALEDCYDWHEQQQEWQGEPPAEVVQYCTPSTPVCEIPVRTDSMAGWDEAGCPTGCAEGEVGDTPPDECCFVEAELETFTLDEWAADGAALLEQIEDDCEAELIEVDVEMECELTDPALGLTSPCPDDSVGETTSASYVMDVDPVDSYLTLHTSSGEDTVALAGTGAGATGPAEFLVAIIDAQSSGQIGSDVFTDLRFWFTEDISLNVNSGAFTIPAAQGYEVKARGKWSGDWFYGVFEPSANATGAFDNQAGTWYLDYTSSWMGGWVDLHLEGTFYATSNP